MATTVAQIAAEVFRVGLFGRVLGLAGLDGHTESASNRTFRGCLRSALRGGGIYVADPLDVTDSDVSGLTGAALEWVVIQTRIHILQEIRLNWDRVEASEEMDIEACKRMEERLNLALKEFLRQLKDIFPQVNGGGPAGVIVGTLQAGKCPPRCP